MRDVLKMMEENKEYKDIITQHPEVLLTVQSDLWSAPTLWRACRKLDDDQNKEDSIKEAIHLLAKADEFF